MSQYVWINATDAAVDEKLGLVSIKMPFTVLPSETKMATLLVALNFWPNELNEIPLPMVKRELKERVDCGYDVDFHFDGHFKPENAEGEEFSLEGSTSDDDIASHPELPMLMEKYQGKLDDNGAVVFPLKLTSEGETGLNPLHGIKSYLVPGFVWTRTYVSKKFPATLARSVGCVDNPPGEPPRIYGKQQWLKTRVQANWRGNIWKIQISWTCSGRAGLPPDVYRYPAK